MALSLSEFRDLFPEFTLASDTLVQNALDRAALRTPANVWGDLEDQGHGYLTAHLLCILPGAKDMRIGKDGSNLYEKERKTLERIVSSGFRVTDG